MHKYEIDNGQAKMFAIECYDAIISEIKAEVEWEEVVGDAAEKDTTAARS